MERSDISLDWISDASPELLPVKEAEDPGEASLKHLSATSCPV
jgi:hypothetical protein